MRLLLDTHAALWWVLGNPKFGPGAREMVADRGNDVLLSVGSVWELIIKVRTGKLTLDVPAVSASWWGQGFQRLGIEPDHLRCLQELPFHHRDPFDHLLAAQAISERAVFLTVDRRMQQYPVDCVDCRQ